MNLEMLLSLALGLVAGAVVGLKVIAPRTSTTVDDEVLKRLEQVEAALKALKG
jgi:hypothetical protein